MAVFTTLLLSCPVKKEAANLNLAALSLDQGNISFNAEQVIYETEVLYTVESVTVSARAVDSAAEIIIDGTDLGAGSGSLAIDLAENWNIITVTTMNETTGEAKAYVVKIHRLDRIKSSLATLGGLSSAPAATLDPAFDPAVTSYGVSVLFGVDSMTFTPIAAGIGATITVNGSPTASGSESDPVSLAVGSNTVTILVTAEDGVTQKTYTVTVTRSAEPVLLGSWDLTEDLLDRSGNGNNGTWAGPTGSVATYADPAGDGRTGVQFRWTESEIDVPQTPIPETTYGYLGGKGDHIDCEAGGNGDLLNADDYLSISFWLFWNPDADPHSGAGDFPFADGPAWPIDGPTYTGYIPATPETTQNTYMNIVNKSAWWESGWQIRQTTEQYVTNDIQLWIHHASGAVAPLAFGATETLTLLDGDDYLNTEDPIVYTAPTYRGRWLHMVVTIDNVNLVAKSYVDGTLSRTSTYNYPFDFVTTEVTNAWYLKHFTIGAFSHPWGGFPVNGEMRLVRFYRGLLDADDVTALYAEGAAP